MEILDKKKTVLLSSMTFLRPENDEYMIVLRVRSGDAELIAEELKASGFNVAHVG